VLTNGNVVVVVEGDQVAELEVTGSGGSLGGNTLHGAAITEEAVGVVVDKLVAGLVEGGSSLALGHGETDGVGETLAEGTSGDLNAGGVVGLGVTRGLGVDLAEVLEVVHGEVVAEEVEQGVLQNTAMAVGEDEAVTVEPLGVLGVEPHELVKEHMGLEDEESAEVQWKLPDLWIEDLRPGPCPWAHRGGQSWTGRWCPPGKSVSMCGGCDGGALVLCCA
jgi:hypothetical protein